MNATTETTDLSSRTTLAHLKIINHKLLTSGRELMRGEHAGASLLVRLTTDRHGRPGATLSLSDKFGRMRASGKGFEYWKNSESMSFKRTADDLVVVRQFHKTNANKHRTFHVFSENSGIKSHVFHMVNSMHNHLLRINATVRRRPYNPQSRIEALVNDENSPLQIITSTGFHTIPLHDDDIERLADQIIDHIGELPSMADRFPMLADTVDRSIHRPAKEYLMFLDAQDASDVARRAFGKRAYTKPLGRTIAKHIDNDSIDVIRWFTLYRGLVPTEWIVGALDRALQDSFRGNLYSIKSSTIRNIRALLRRLPKPVLRRLLEQNLLDAAAPLIDAGASIGDNILTMRDINVIAELIELRGQKNLRNARDVENLVRRAPQLDRHTYGRNGGTGRVLEREGQQRREMERYNEQMGLVGRRRVNWATWNDSTFQEEARIRLMEIRDAANAERERQHQIQREERRQQQIAENAERHQWALSTAAAIRQMQVEGYTVAVARNANDLSHWGATMGNCIGDSYMDYGDNLELDVFVAVTDATGRMILNMQITRDRGVTQMLGFHNANLDEIMGIAEARRLIRAFQDAGVIFSDHVLGARRILQEMAGAH